MHRGPAATRSLAWLATSWQAGWRRWGPPPHLPIRRIVWEQTIRAWIFNGWYLIFHGAFVTWTLRRVRKEYIRHNSEA